MLLVSHMKEFDEFKEVMLLAFCNGQIFSLEYLTFNILLDQPDLLLVFGLHLYIVG